MPIRQAHKIPPHLTIKLTLGRPHLLLHPPCCLHRSPLPPPINHPRRIILNGHIHLEQLIEPVCDHVLEAVLDSFEAFVLDLDGSFEADYEGLQEVVAGWGVDFLGGQDW
jgi:hypothetical protein